MGESAVADIKGLAKKKGLEVTFRNPGKKIFAEVDVVRVREVIDNLLSNSVKYTKAGYIEVSITEDDASIAFSIKDTGIGIKKEDQALLFKKFSRVENYIGGEEGSIVRPGGTGLGLYVAKTIVDAHSGTLTVESEIGKGSTFTFTIPKHQPSYVRRTEGPQQKYVPTHVTLPGDITTETADVKTGAVSAILHQTQKPETPAASTPQPDAPPQADDEPK